jgi:hypothetical protein
MRNLRKRVSEAVPHFWEVRSRQADRQGAATGRKDAGERGAVTGGAQPDGFTRLLHDMLSEAGLDETDVHWKRRPDLPGYFRPEKCWDLLAVADGRLLAVIECKSQVGPSFGNNYNNRTEESLGSATDLWAAYREGAHAPSDKPWLGYLMLLEEAPGSTRPIGVTESHFQVFEEFRNASYAQRYEVLLTRLLRERLYDGACLLLSSRATGIRGRYREPSPELSFERFATSLLARAIAFSQNRE